MEKWAQEISQEVKYRIINWQGKRNRNRGNVENGNDGKKTKEAYLYLIITVQSSLLNNISQDLTQAFNWKKDA